MTATKTLIACAFFLLALINSVNAQTKLPVPRTRIPAAGGRLYKKLDRDNAIIYYEKASVEFQTLGNVEQFVNAYNQIGVILTRQDKYEKARSIWTRPYQPDSPNSARTIWRSPRPTSV